MLDENLLAELQKYVNRRQERVMRYACYLLADIADVCMSDGELEKNIDENRQPPFSQVLFGLIDEKGTVDADIYKKAGIDRRHFSIG